MTPIEQAKEDVRNVAVFKRDFREFDDALEQLITTAQEFEREQCALQVDWLATGASGDAKVRMEHIAAMIRGPLSAEEMPQTCQSDAITVHGVEKTTAIPITLVGKIEYGE